MPLIILTKSLFFDISVTAVMDVRVICDVVYTLGGSISTLKGKTGYSNNNTITKTLIP
jgi:hypothetical protein